jgi:hypothetical protein
MRRSTVITVAVATAAASLFTVAIVSMTAHALSVKLLQMLSPLPSETTVKTQGWNGLPEGFKFEPFLDLEHPFDRTDFENPWGPAVRFFNPKCRDTTCSETGFYAYRASMATIWESKTIPSTTGDAGPVVLSTALWARPHLSTIRARKPRC